MQLVATGFLFPVFFFFLSFVTFYSSATTGLGYQPSRKEKERKGTLLHVASLIITSPRPLLKTLHIWLFLIRTLESGPRARSMRVSLQMNPSCLTGTTDESAKNTLDRVILQFRPQRAPLPENIWVWEARVYAWESVPFTQRPPHESYRNILNIRSWEETFFFFCMVLMGIFKHRRWWSLYPSPPVQLPST